MTAANTILLHWEVQTTHKYYSLFRHEISMAELFCCSLTKPYIRYQQTHVQFVYISLHYQSFKSFVKIILIYGPLYFRFHFFCHGTAYVPILSLVKECLSTSHSTPIVPILSSWWVDRLVPCLTLPISWKSDVTGMVASYRLRASVTTDHGCRGTTQREVSLHKQGQQRCSGTPSLSRT